MKISHHLPVVFSQVAVVAATSIGLLHVWRRRLDERATLARLDDRELRDIGTSRYETRIEVNKPFWRA